MSGPAAPAIAVAAAAGGAAAGYARLRRRRLLVLAGLAVALAASLAVDVAWGPSRLGLWEVLAALLAPDSATDATRVIVWQVRLPFALMSIAVGAALGLAGAEMQTILHNPLASPFTLGVSAAASFGASLAIVFHVGWAGFGGAWMVPVNAFCFALLATLMIQGLSRLRGVSVESLVLFGIALVFTFNALLALVQFVASEQALQEVVFWMLGSMAKATWDKLALLVAALVLCLPLSLSAAWRMTALRLGEERAAALGIRVGRLRLASLARVSLLAALATAFVGTIGFIGLVGPHIARMLVGEDHRLFLPGAALSGALVMSLASIASKAIVPGLIIPIGIVTALVGIPFFVSLVLASRRQSWRAA